MRVSSIRALVIFCTVLVVSLIMTACGGGNSFVSPPPPPPASEFLFAAANNTVITFGVDTGTGALTQTSFVDGNHGGFGIVANPKNTFLYTDDLAAGGIDGFSIGTAGALSAISGSPFPMPSGWSHLFVDSLAVDPAGKFLYAPDAANNVVAGFTIDASSGALASIQGSPFPAGLGPQEVAVHSSGRFLYVDPQGSISAFTIDSTTGALTEIAGSPFPTDTGYAPDGLVAHPSGKFLYAALPFENSIAAFSIDVSTGGLTPLAGSPFSIGQMGMFVISWSIATTPSGKFLYALDSGNGKVYGYSIDANSGALTAMAGSPFAIFIETFMSTLQVEPSEKFLYVGVETGGMQAMNIDGTTGALTLDPALTIVAYGPSMTIIRVP
jgi:6-phosphogluconolactonase (cycloisomerase 2 family)